MTHSNQCIMTTVGNELYWSMEQKDKEVTKERKELIHKHVKELRSYNAALLVENDMFGSFIGRLDPLDLEFQGEGEGPQAAGDSHLDEGGVEMRQKPHSTSSDFQQKLTLEQKLFVVQREVTDTQKDQEELKQKYEKIQDSYKASLKEAELRLAEIRKAKKEFEHRLLKSMSDGRLEMKEPEKVLQYTEDRSKTVQLEKYHLKNQALKVQEKKLLQKLQQKKEMGKAEYEVFFQEYDEPRMNKSLDEHQFNNVKVQHVLGVHKEKLQSVTLESAELSNDIAKKKEILVKIEKEIHHAEKERLKAEGINSFLHKELTDYQAPDVIEYMHVKEKHKKLQQSVHKWERKVGIAEMALKTHTREWSKQRFLLTNANSAESGPTRSGEHQKSVKLPNIAEEKCKK